MTTASTDIETRLRALELEVARLRERLEYTETLEGIRRGLEDVAAGRVRPAREVFEDLRKKHGIPNK
jgi:hypothetical protein